MDSILPSVESVIDQNAGRTKKWHTGAAECITDVLMTLWSIAVLTDNNMESIHISFKKRAEDVNGDVICVSVLQKIIIWNQSMNKWAYCAILFHQHFKFLVWILKILLTHKKKTQNWTNNSEVLSWYLIESQYSDVLYNCTKWRANNVWIEYKSSLLRTVHYFCTVKKSV